MVDSCQVPRGAKFVKAVEEFASCSNILDLGALLNKLPVHTGKEQVQKWMDQGRLP